MHTKILTYLFLSLRNPQVFEFLITFNSTPIACKLVMRKNKTNETCTNPNPCKRLRLRSSLYISIRKIQFFAKQIAAKQEKDENFPRESAFRDHVPIGRENQMKR